MNYNTRLNDCQVADKNNNWTGRKTNLEKVADVMERINARKAEKLHNCGNHLLFSLAPNGDKTLVSADFCHLRICPLCAWRRSRKLGVQMSQTLERMPPTAKYIMVTLTIRNMTRDELSDGITELLQGYMHLCKYKEVKDYVIASYRAVEVTYNADEDTYHPHIHVLYAVKPSYFGEGYLNQIRWVKLWQRAVRVDYAPDIDVRRVKPKTDENGDISVYKAICEVTKYPTKVYDVLSISDERKRIEVLRTLDSCLHKRRLVSFGGLFADIRKELRMADIDTDKDLIHTGCSDVLDSDSVKVAYVWRSGVYIPIM